MVFSSLEFIFVFLPLFLLFYYVIPYTYKNIILLIFSFIFYITGSIKQPFFIIIIVLSVIINYLIGLKIYREKRKKKLYLIIGIVYNLTWLFLFKYLSFVCTQLNHLFIMIHLQIPIIQLILPIGISFYTFQSLSYLIDVYNHKIKAERNLVKFAIYIMMFPQLIAGPIINYQDIKDQLNTRHLTIIHLSNGLKDFIIGLGYKVLLANRIASLWNDVEMIGFESISTPLAYLGVLAFSLQIYLDFYGYSLMAIGLGKMIGFDISVNFRYPYLSKSMSEFYRRWHITLGTWFKKYVYIPLGGNRLGQYKTIRNLCLVWLLTGLWHGANWNFVLWGMVVCSIIILEKLFLKKVLEQHPFFARLYMIFLIMITWTLFAVTDLHDLGLIFIKLIPIVPTTAMNTLDFIKYLKIYGWLIVVCLLFCTNIPNQLFKKFKNSHLEYLILLLIFWGSIYCLCVEANDPFLYFRF